MDDDWTEAGVEPSIDEILREPIVRLLMYRDGVTPDDVRLVISDASRRLQSRSGRRTAAA